ncbi:hypothetical protein [Sphingopyxis panaciterrae]
MTTIRHRWTARAAIAAAVLGLMSSALAEPHSQKNPEIDAQSHDLQLPRWGPYSNAYLGVSHIPDLASGMRFDITIFAGPHTTSTPDVPNASLNTGFVAWEAAPDLSYHSYRQKLEGQQVYAEIAFAALDPASDSRLIRVDLVNGGTRAKTMTLNLLASMQLPNRAPGSVLTPRRILRASIPAGGTWVSGVHYRAHRRARRRRRTGSFTMAGCAARFARTGWSMAARCAWRRETRRPTPFPPEPRSRCCAIAPRRISRWPTPEACRFPPPPTAGRGRCRSPQARGR